MKKIILFIQCCMAALGNAAPPPNVVFILADDLGWSDTTLLEMLGLPAADGLRPAITVHEGNWKL